MPGISNWRRFKARCEECQFRSPRWTTVPIARVEAAGHRQRDGHDAFIEDADGKRVAL